MHPVASLLTFPGMRPARGSAPSMGSVCIRAGWSGSVAYTLPAPEGYWVANTFPCAHVAGLADAQQPCQLLATLPDLEGAIISTLPVGDAEQAGGVDEDYPYACAAGFFGDASASAQTSMRCSGVCPAGFSCPSGTVAPLPCESGGFCAVGSAVATRCTQEQRSMWLVQAAAFRSVHRVLLPFPFFRRRSARQSHSSHPAHPTAH